MISHNSQIFVGLLALMLSGCGGFSGDDQAPFATRAEIESFLAVCKIDNAKILRGAANTTDWIVDFESVTKSKWDCLKLRQAEAGVMAQMQATKVT